MDLDIVTTQQSWVRITKFSADPAGAELAHLTLQSQGDSWRDGCGTLNGKRGCIQNTPCFTDFQPLGIWNMEIPMSSYSRPHTFYRYPEVSNFVDPEWAGVHQPSALWRNSREL